MDAYPLSRVVAMRYGITLALVAGLSLAGTTAFAPQQIEEGFVNSPGGVKLHYRLVGTGRDTVVVIADGPAGHIGAIAPDVSGLTRRHRVLFYDQRGSGTSSAPAELRLDDHVRDLEAIRMYVGMRRMRILAHGWGAAIATQYAAKNAERVERMVLIAPLPIRKQLHDDANAALLARLDDVTRARLAAVRNDLETTPDPIAACRTIQGAERPALVADAASAALIKGSACSAPAEAVRFALSKGVPGGWASLGEYDFRRGLEPITGMVLVVHGDRDVTPLASAEEWAGSLPQARLLRVANAGHFPYVEQGAAFWGAVDTLMSGSWPGNAVAITRIIADR